MLKTVEKYARPVAVAMIFAIGSPVIAGCGKDEKKLTPAEQHDRDIADKQLKAWNDKRAKIAELKARIEEHKAEVREKRQLHEESLKERRLCERRSAIKVIGISKNEVEIDYPPKYKYLGLDASDDCVIRDPQERDLKYVSKARLTCIGTALVQRSTDYAEVTEHNVVTKHRTTYSDGHSSTWTGDTYTHRKTNHSTDHLVTSHGIRSEIHTTTIPNHEWCPDVTPSEVKSGR